MDNLINSGEVYSDFKYKLFKWCYDNLTSNKEDVYANQDVINANVDKEGKLSLKIDAYNTLQDKISIYNTKVTNEENAQTQVDNLTSQISDLTYQISDIEAYIEENGLTQEELDQANTDLTNLQSQLSTNNTNISDLQSQISVIQTYLLTEGLSQEVIDEKNGEITTLQSQIDTLTSDNTSINTQITNLQNTIDIQVTVGEKIVEIEGLENDKTQAESDLTDANTNLTSAQSEKSSALTDKTNAQDDYDTKSDAYDQSVTVYETLVANVTDTYEDNYIDYIKDCMTNSFTVYKTLYGPYICESDLENFVPLICDRLVIDNDYKTYCDDIFGVSPAFVFSSSCEVDIKKILIKRDEAIAHYIYYPIAKFFEQQLSPTTNISDWLMGHIEIGSIGDQYDTIEFVDVSGLNMPTISDLESVEIPVSAQMLGKFENTNVLELGPIKTSGIISALLLTRDKIIALKNALGTLSSSVTTIGNAVTTHTSSLTSISSTLASINTKLELLKGAVNPSLW